MRITIDTDRGRAVLYNGKRVQKLTDHRKRVHPVEDIVVLNIEGRKRVNFKRDGKLCSYPVLAVSSK